MILDVVKITTECGITKFSFNSDPFMNLPSNGCISGEPWLISVAIITIKNVSSDTSSEIKIT
jgi:hypothetical protein